MNYFSSVHFYRLKSPFNGNETVWMVVSEDKSKALVGYYRVLNGVNLPYSCVKLQGLIRINCMRMNWQIQNIMVMN